MAIHSFVGATLCLLSLSYFLPDVLAHGRLLTPPSRASLWRFGFPAKRDYNDNQGFCGGMNVLHNKYESKCGVCGDPWLPVPREHEKGGKYYSGIITAKYQAGDEIVAEVEITANHKGFFEFRVCPYDKPATGDLELDEGGEMIEVSQSCLDKHILQLSNGQGTKYQITDKIGIYKVGLKIPADLHCEKCLFQWRYKTGNSWGVDPNGKGCTGCGKQEEFKACADIVISPSGTKRKTTIRRTVFTTTGPAEKPKIKQTPITESPVIAKKAATKETKRGECQPSVEYSQVAGMTKWCNDNCASNYCPETHCTCNSDP